MRFKVRPLNPHPLATFDVRYSPAFMSAAPFPNPHLAAPESDAGGSAFLMNLWPLTVLAVIGLAAGLLDRAAAAAAPAASTPNVLVIHCDQLNFRTLGCYRSLLPKEQAFVWGDGVAVATPHIDSLASNGVLCDKCYAASPVCTPSRASFLTGRYPQNTGASQNNRPLDDSVVTFAETLRRRGYATGYAGKWHLDGPAMPGWTPRRHFGFTDNTYMFNRGHWKQLADSPSGPREIGQANVQAVEGSDEKSYTTDFLAGKAVQFIQEHQHQPFCYMVAFPDPHNPRAVRSPYDTLFSHLKFSPPRTARLPATDMPFWGTTLQAKFDRAADYFGMVKCIDDNVGKILTELKADALLDHTIIVFTADHGDMCGEHGRNFKDIPFEASAKIPFLICAPGRLKPGTVVSAALSNTDFKPTLLKLMGLPADPQDQGRDVSALLLSGQTPKEWNDIVFTRMPPGRNGPWMAAFTPRYKLVLSPRGQPCLLDLQADPDELTNVFLQPAYRQTVRELARALVDYARKFKDPMADTPSVRADLAWATAEGDSPYAPVKRTAPAKPGASQE